MITKHQKEGIITEYLTTEITYRELGKKHGLDFRTIHAWVQRFQGKMRNRKPYQKPSKVTGNTDVALPSEVKKLQEELRKARLLNELLSEVITIAEEDLKVPIRKKYGTRQS